MTTVTAPTTLTAATRRRWWQGLTVVLAVTYLLIGLLSPDPFIRWPLVIGALLVTGALVAAPRSRPAAWAALVAGALAPVVTTWWSVAGPITAMLILGCGTTAIRSTTTAVPTPLQTRRCEQPTATVPALPTHPEAT